MRNARFAALALAACLVAAFVVPGVATAAKKKAGPVVVGTDVDGDWGADPQLAPLADALGQDLVSATISMADPNTVNFVIGLNALPPTGGAPEISRYFWAFNVNGEAYELDGKFTNYSRGACDPQSGGCPPPRDPGMQPFLLRGDCAPDPTATNVIVCKELGKIQATFDAAAGTITIPVTLDLIKAKPGTKIDPGLISSLGGSVGAVPSAYFSSGDMPHDLLAVTKSFTISK